LSESTGETDQPWGFWVILRNEADAHWALKVSGLVVFLMGMGFLFASYASLSHFAGAPKAAGDSLGGVLANLAGALFMVVGARMHLGSYGLFPLSAAVFLLLSLFQIWLVPSPFNLVLVLEGVLIISGIRAWFYLRRLRREKAAASTLT
jgi:hypothetical protein